MNLLQSLDYSVLQQCMHCGMCLPTCPTYMETKRERNSPRGRISLMRSIADGDLQVTRAFSDEMYYCLGCLACQTACPAGVNYAELFETARAEVERAGVAQAPERDFWRWITLNVLFMHPRLLRLVGWGMRQWQKTGLDVLLRRVKFFGLLPGHLRALEPQTPRMAEAFSDALIEPVETPMNWEMEQRDKAGRADETIKLDHLPAPDAQGRRVPKYRVGLLTGCVQDLAFSNINRDTADVLLANGCEVVTPRAQACCGSLHAHNGAVELARELARRQIDTFGNLESYDAIITNAGGCGSHLKQYGHLLHEDPLYASRARLWDKKVQDIHQWLAVIGIRKPEHGVKIEGDVTYHESCHLCHGQKVVSQPRQVLNAIPGLKLKEMTESNWCCGSAGIYNITQPEQSQKLLARKVGHIQSSRATVVATSNPGCHLQIVNGLKARGIPVEVTQPVTLLAKAYRGRDEVSNKS